MATLSEKIAPYQGWIDQYSKKYGVDPEIVTAIIQHESGFDPNAKAKGSSATGLGQTTLATAKDLGFSAEDRLDPEKSIEMVAKNAAQKIAHYGGDVSKGLLAYNQGIGGADAILAGKGTPEQMKGGNAYTSAPIFRKWTNPTQATANPVAALQQPTEAPLQGGALLSAKPQTQEQATTQAVGGADMGAQQLQTNDYLRQLQEQNQQALQSQQEKDEEERRKLEADKRSQAYQTATLGLISLLGGNNNKTQTSVTQSAPTAAGGSWSAPTQDVLRRLYNFGGLQGGK